MIPREAFTARIGMLIGLGFASVALSAVAPVLQDTYGNISYVLCMLAAGAVAYAATACARGAPQASAVAIILVVAVVVRVIAMSYPPLISTDIYRYVWDGRVEGAGINPYLYVPADPALAFLRDQAIYPLVNRATYAHTAYPPFAQMFFFLVTRFGDTLFSMRLALVLCEAGIVYAIALLLRQTGRPPALIVAYAWHPLAVWETANGGHIDTLVTLLVVAALLALTSGRRLWGAALVAFAILVKPYAVILLAAFWRRWDWRAPVLVVSVVAALYLPYLGAGMGVIGFVPGYFQEEGLDSGSAFWLVLLTRRIVGEVPGLQIAYVLLGLAVFAAFAMTILRRGMLYETERQYRDAMILLAIGLFFLSPNYAWYYLPLVPFVALGGGLPLWAMTLGAVLLHASWPGMETNTRFLILKSLLNMGWMLALILIWARSTRRARADDGVRT